MVFCNTASANIRQVSKIPTCLPLLCSFPLASELPLSSLSISPVRDSQNMPKPTQHAISPELLPFAIGRLGRRKKAPAGMWAA